MGAFATTSEVPSGQGLTKKQTSPETGKEEWAEGHYSGAYHLPLKQLVSSLPQTLSDRSKSLLFYGDGSKRATRIAQDLGYTRVGYLVHGSYKGLEHRSPPIRHEM